MFLLEMNTYMKILHKLFMANSELLRIIVVWYKVIDTKYMLL